MSDLANLQTNIVAQFEADNSYLEELINDEITVSQTMLMSLQKEAESLMATARGNHAILINTKKPPEAVARYLAEGTFTQIRRKYHIYWSKIEDKIIKEAKTDTTFNSNSFHDSQIGPEALK